MAGSQPGYVTLVNAPTQTNAGMDTPLTFSQLVGQVTIQNNSTINAWISFDGATANGALLVAPNDILIATKPVLTVYVNTPQSININGLSTPNIVVLGEA
jgi:hypothetical protein